MLKQRYKNSLIISLLLHVAVVSILIVSFEFNSKAIVLENSDKNIQAIHAVVMEAPKIERPDPAPLPSVQNKPEPVPQKKSLPSPKPIEKKQAEIKKVEPRTVSKAIAITNKQKKIIHEDVLEKQLLSDLQEIKKQNKKKHQDIEKAFEKELKSQTAKTLEQQLLDEQNRLTSAAQTQKMRGVIDKYKALILQSIAQHWLVPAGVDKKLTAQLLIRIAPGGTVLDVQLVKSSGDIALDQSARTAVFKASPLPVPSDSDEFDPFRQFILKVKPENILAKDNEFN